jgi:hypothetical protein
MQSLTRGQIRSKILAGESFWVGSKTERVYACDEIKRQPQPYVTRSDDRDGFYIVKITLPQLKKLTTKGKLK